MLVLTRKMDQKIQIGQTITVTVLRVKGGAVRIGIEAPSGVRILRAELSSGAESQNQDSVAGGESRCSEDLAPTAAGASESMAGRSRPKGEPAGEGEDSAANEAPPYLAGPRPCRARRTAAPGGRGGHRLRPLVRFAQKDDSRHAAASRAIGLGTMV